MTQESQFPYLHGFSDTEQERLKKQARFVEHVVYPQINFSDVSELLEVGCGVGAQSEILLRRFPDLNLTGIDLSETQLDEAKKSLSKIPYAKDRHRIMKMDASKMSFESNSFDGGFLCWVLEHIPNPKKVLGEVRRVLRPGSPIVITEVLNSSFFLDPYSPNLWKYWMAFNDYQIEMGGDPFVGAKLGNLLLQLGYTDIQTEVKTLHFDNRWPQKRKEMIEFWTELLLSAAEQLIKDEKVDEETVKAASEELKSVANDVDAVFYYSFIQAKAKVSL